MNDYSDNQYNMSNNCDQSYGQKSDGEYSYSYRPKNCCTNQANVIIGKYILLGAVSILLAMMVVLPGIILRSLAMRRLLNGSQDHSSYIGNSQGNPTLSDHGISTVDITSKNLFYYHRYGITSKGVIVTGSEYTDELEFGDKIVSVNGVNISVSDDIEAAVSNCSAGDTIKVVVERGGEEITVFVTLREQVPDYVDFE